MAKIWTQDDHREISRALATLKTTWLIIGNHVYSKDKISSIIRIYHQKNGKILRDDIKNAEGIKNFAALQEKLYSRLLKSISGENSHNPASHFPIVKSQPAFSHFAHGLYLMSKGKNNSALQEFRTALTLQPDFRDLHYFLGKYYVSSEFSYEKASDHFHNILNSHPDDAPAWFWLGFTLNLKGDNTAAVNAMEQAKRLKPSEFSAYYYLATLYQDAGNHTEALKNYQKALELSPRNALLWYQAASLYARLDRKNDALNALSKALELDAKSFLDIARFDADFAKWKHDRDFKELFDKYKK